MVLVSIKVKKLEKLTGQLSVEIVTLVSLNVIARHLNKREKIVARNNNMYSFMLACILQAPYKLHI
jgi:TRAP-type mannitol/chloroaromatic compound transport system permease small subunit